MSSLFYRNINTHTTFSHSGKKRIMTVSVASRLAEVDDLTARHVSAYHSRSARISLRNAQYHVAKGNISLQRSASFNADRVGISLALRANITAQRAISRCQRQHITATLRVARVGLRDGIITPKACMESRRSLVWNPQLVAVWNHGNAVYESLSLRQRKKGAVWHPLRVPLTVRTGFRT